MATSHQLLKGVRLPALNCATDADRHLSQVGRKTLVARRHPNVAWSVVRPRRSGPKKALVMATCGGGDKELTKALTSAGVVFGSTVEEVYSVDSCVAWSILYNRLFDHGFEREDLKVTLKATNAAIRGDFIHRR